MTPSMNRFFRKIAAAGILSVSAITLGGCDVVYDGLDPCPQGVRLRFIYEYNMDFANAFPSQVDCLTLLVYDGEGKYVKTVTETSAVLADENWRMTLNLIPGEYRLEAWGGLADSDASFHFNADPAVTPMTSLKVAMNDDCIHPDNKKGVDLHPLFYGSLDVTVPENSLDYVEGTVQMMKDTNNLRILLQNLDGTPVLSDDYSFSITDDNTLLAYNNDVIPGHAITYHPWAQGEVSAGLSEEGNEVVLTYAELSTSRYTLDTRPHLIIKRNEDGKVIVDIPLVNYLLLYKSDKFANMGSQEYLDRESRWDMIFFMQDGLWMDAYIVINDWVVRINDVEP